MRITRAKEQNFTDKAGARMCLRRVEVAGDPEVRFTLMTAGGFYRIGKVSGGCERLQREWASSWWFAEPVDEDACDGGERLWEQAYDSVASILRRYGAVS